mmetsp:Transcript_395/g.1517  ORF Transcript_395/g.1517 Transcript_395/m.1517 type:complete len:242 (-) Transcript_395:119-844(-)
MADGEAVVPVRGAPARESVTCFRSEDCAVRCANAVDDVAVEVGDAAGRHRAVLALQEARVRAVFPRAIARALALCLNRGAHGAARALTPLAAEVVEAASSLVHAAARSNALVVIPRALGCERARRAVFVARAVRRAHHAVPIAVVCHGAVAVRPSTDLKRAQVAAGKALIVVVIPEAWATAAVFVEVVAVVLVVAVLGAIRDAEVRTLVARVRGGAVVVGTDAVAGRRAGVSEAALCVARV